MNLMAIIIVAIVSVCNTSCGKDESDDLPFDNTNNTEDDLSLNDYSRKIIDTSWRLGKMTHYRYNNTVSTSNKYTGVIEFSKNLYNYQVDLSNGHSYTNHEKKMYLDGVHVGYWDYNREGLSMRFNDDWEEKNDHFAYGAVYMNAKITDNTMTLTKEFSEVNERYTWTYYLVRRGDYNISVNPETGDSSNPDDGNSNQSLYFTNFYSTSTQTSVTVKFYTNERATSATIKYGKTSATSSVSTTIANKEISATIRNLSKGTKYFVKCTAANSNGSVTSEEYPVMTNY